MKYTIKSASACYTGGGIYVYHGELDNGLWFSTCDTWESVLICNACPNFEESGYPEWQNAHMVEELTDRDYATFFNAMLRHIIEGKRSFDGSKNYSVSELEERFVKIDNKEVKPMTLFEKSSAVGSCIVSFHYDTEYYDSWYVIHLAICSCEGVPGFYRTFTFKTLKAAHAKMEYLVEKYHI